MKLSAKIILSILLLLVSSLSVSGWFSVQREKQILHRLLEKQGKSISQAIAVSCIETLLSEDYPLLDTILGTTGRQRNDILAIEVTQEGKVVSHYHSAHDNDRIGKIFSSDIVFSIPGEDKSKKLGEIHLKLSDQENRVIVSNRIRELIFNTGIIFVFLCIALLVLMRRIILQKVKRLDTFARLIGDGCLDARVDLQTGDELGKLASTMNRMTEKISSSQQEIERQNEELKKLSAVKSEFLANMSHEIRTPMNGVLGMANILLATDLSKEQQKYASIVRSSANSLLSIINDILDFSKIEAGKLDLESIPFDLRNTLEETIDTLAMQAREKGLELVCLVEPDVENYLLGDQGRLRQVLINLLTNALKFTEEGEVSLHVSLAEKKETGQMLSFTVNDTGIGISSTRQDSLFDAFTQANGSTTRKYGGTGLGLTICRKLVTLMGGDIGVESEIDRGSTFWFTAWFPKLETDGQELTATSFPFSQINTDSFRNVRILAVDDNQTNRRLLTLLLDSWQCRHEIIANPLQVIPTLHKAVKKNDPFHIGILDMQMPEMDGATLGKEIKKNPDINSIRLIMMSSQILDSDREKLIDAGFEAYFAKPVKQSELFNCLYGIVFDKELTEDEIEQESTVLNSPEKNQDIRILLVEDNEINQHVAVVALANMGFSAETAANGLEALQALETVDFDLVLMDCQMPEMDGYEATRELRRLEKGSGKHIPVIAMTANAMMGDREKCIAAGMDDHVAKPFDFKYLHETICKWLGMKIEGQPETSPQKAGNKDVQISLPDLTAINVADGMTRYGDDQDLYFKSLKKFAANHGRSADEIRTALEMENTEKAIRYAHTLKGLASLIGAVDLEKTARELESGISHDDVNVESLLESLEAHLTQVLADIETVAAMGDSPGKEGQEETIQQTIVTESGRLKVILKEFMDLLEDDLAEAEKRLNELREHLAGTEHTEIITSIYQSMEEYDYDQVKKEVAELVSNLILSGILL